MVATKATHPQKPKKPQKPQNQAGKQQIEGPDNPTSQLLPIMSNKCCSGTGKEGKTKEVVEDREVKQNVCVTQLYVKAGV